MRSCARKFETSKSQVQTGASTLTQSTLSTWERSWFASGGKKLEQGLGPVIGAFVLRVVG
jgi:hypothetical protein